MWLLDKLLKRVIKNGKLVITDHDGKVYEYGAGGEVEGGYAEPVHVRLTNPKAAMHIARYPQLGTAEAFMWGWMDIVEPHDLRDLILFFTAQSKAIGDAAIQPQSKAKWLAQKAIAKADSINLPGKARKNAEHTYNLTRRLYELFLDEDRQYTMGYHRSLDVSLEQAQLDKRAHLAAKLNITAENGPNMRVLDIGCGWGGFALYLNRMYGCEVLGVALAPDQIAFCKERAAEAGVSDKVKFALMDYREVRGEFDRISSIGLLEHVGTPHYPQFYEHTAKLLKPKGVMLSHACGRAGPPGFTDAFTRKYIFPGGYIPALSELITQSEQFGWQVMDVEAMRFHYCHTLEEWYNRTVMHKDELVEMYDEQFYRMWLFYLAGAEQAFRNGGLVNHQIVYVKDRTALPMTRDFMYEEERRLFAMEEAPRWHLDPALKEAAE